MTDTIDTTKQFGQMPYGAARFAGDMTGGEAKVFIVLIAHNAYRCSPGADAIARYAKMPRSAVFRALKGLEAKGHIAIEHGGGRMKSNVYTIQNGVTDDTDSGANGRAGATVSKGSRKGTNGRAGDAKRSRSDSETVSKSPLNGRAGATRIDLTEKKKKNQKKGDGFSLLFRGDDHRGLLSIACHARDRLHQLVVEGDHEVTLAGPYPPPYPPADGVSRQIVDVSGPGAEAFIGEMQRAEQLEPHGIEVLTDLSGKERAPSIGDIKVVDLCVTHRALQLRQQAIDGGIIGAAVTEVSFLALCERAVHHPDIEDPGAYLHWALEQDNPLRYATNEWEEPARERLNHYRNGKPAPRPPAPQRAERVAPTGDRLADISAQHAANEQWREERAGGSAQSIGEVVAKSPTVKQREERKAREQALTVEAVRWLDALSAEQLEEHITKVFDDDDRKVMAILPPTSRRACVVNRYVRDRTAAEATP